jgi:uncharacterized membrane protein (UPF0127 family)
MANPSASIAGCPNVWTRVYPRTGPRSVVSSCITAFTAAFLFLSQGLHAQGLRPFEPLNPAKAQSLPETPLVIESDGSHLEFVIELADTTDEQAIGLMHRNFLAPDRGMLFDYKGPRRPRFWMRNTFISLDMLFIRGDGEIAYIAENTVPHSERRVDPRQLVQAVLELPAGTVERLNIKTGDRVRHQIFENSSPP